MTGKKLARLIVQTTEKGSEIKNSVEIMGLDADYVAKLLIDDGRFLDASTFFKSKSERIKKAQEFLDLFFQGKIKSESKDILFALSYVPYKKNILTLFENKKYFYELTTLVSIFKNTRSKESKRKIAILMLLNFRISGDFHNSLIKTASDNIKNVLTSDDIAYVIGEQLRKDVHSREANYISEILDFEDPYEKVYEYLDKNQFIEKRDYLLGRVALYHKKEKIEDIPMDYWIETSISLNVMSEKGEISFIEKQLESRLQYLLKSAGDFYFVKEVAKMLKRKITSEELDIYIKNSSGAISRVDDEEFIEFTDDQFIEIMKSRSKFRDPVSLRWFWDHYSREYNKTLQRLIKERPEDIKAVLETILEALFNSDFKKESHVIKGLLRDIGRSMTEKERNKYLKEIYGIWI